MARLPETFEGPVQIAIIGGTGISSLPSFTPVAVLPLTHPSLRTPWGSPSSPITVLSHPQRSPSTSQSLNVAFLARHGLHHEYAPHEVNSRANIAALRKIGVRCVVAFSAVGSLKEEVRPRDFLCPDQVIDRTKGVRPWTYFEDGVVSHVGFADPFDNELRKIIFNAVEGKGVLEGENVKMHETGLLVCMEGPQFSTRAESIQYRSYDASVINMSCIPEAKLAREAEISYAMICMATDYDSWHSDHDDVSVDIVMQHMAANAKNAKRVVSAVLDALGVGQGEDEVVASVVKGEKWKGFARGGLSGITKEVEKRKKAIERLEWLFPGEFGP